MITKLDKILLFMATVAVVAGGVCQADEGGSMMARENELKKVLSKEQYHVTRENGTEPPFANEYWDNKREGIYVDVISGEPLFSSKDKFESGTGWPSFTAPLREGVVVERTDRNYGMVRTEARSKSSDSHLGHVFNDGPAPTGLRYCINSAALRFVPIEKMAEEGYDVLLTLFGKMGEYKEVEEEQQKAEGQSEEVVFAAGCFWGVEQAFQKVPGVKRTTVGYIGGSTENPTYEDVCTDRTGHAEAVRVEFDPTKLSFSDLLKVFWTIHNPTTKNRQGPDVGTQYRSAIFYTSESQKEAALESMKEEEATGKHGKPIVTQIAPASRFYPAEEYHQNYLKKQWGRVCHGF